MSIANKTLAVLGGTRIDCEIVRAAKELGLKTVVISYDKVEDSPAKQIADVSAEISIANVEDVAAYIKENRIDGVMVGYSDTLLPWYAEICELAGLPCYGSKELFKLFTDKPSWKSECRRHGIPTADEYDEGILAAEDGDLRFPLFLKPARGSGSRGTSIVRNKNELMEGWRKASKSDPQGNVLVERYLEGPEVTVFWLFIDGEYYVTQLGNRHVRNDQEDTIPLPVGYTFPSEFLPDYLRDIAPNVRKMLKANGVRNGMMFMQCIVQDGVTHVYDIGYRLTGSLEYRLTKAISGFSSMDMLIHYAITGKMTDDARIDEKINKALYTPCFNISILMRPGTILRFDGFEEAACDDRVIAAVKAHVEGETLPPEAKGELRQISLRILGSAADAGSMREAAISVQESIDVIDLEGRSLKLPGLSRRDFEAVLR